MNAPAWRRLATVGSLARAGTWRGWLWTVAIALDFFLISSPLALEPVFDDSLGRAVLCTSLACLVSLPFLRVPRVPWSVVAFLAFGFASALWSINHDRTIHFAALYAVLTVLAVVTAANVEVRVLAHGIVLGGAVVVATSLYAYFAELPGADVAPGSSGFIAGVGTNRNILAYTMILAFAAAIGTVPRRRTPRAVWALAVVAIVAGVVLAESATGIAALAVLSSAAVVMGTRDHLVAAGRPPGRRYLAILAGIVVALAVIGVGWYEALHRSLQRDLSLTGRVQIWEAAWSASSSGTRLVGDGWGAVWPHPWRPAPYNGAFDGIVQHIGHTVTHGHNSVFDLLPELGLVGVALFALVYVQSLARAVRQRRPGSTPEARAAGRFTILGVIGLVLAGVTEPLSTVPLGFLVAVLLVATVHREPPAEPVSEEPVPEDPVRTPEPVAPAS